MPDLPPSVYCPVILALCGVVVYQSKRVEKAEADKDAVQDRWSAYQEQRLPVQAQTNTLIERMLAVLED